MNVHVWCQRIVAAEWFERGIVSLIVFNAIVLGLETSPQLVARWGEWMLWINHFVLVVFVLEALIKMIAVWPALHRYFGDGWNLFDFSVVVLSLIPATGEYAMIARLARLLRVLRLVSTLPGLRLIVHTLVSSIPGMVNVILLLSIIFYMYGVAGYHLLHEHDPTHWRSLGISLLTLFRVVTLEDWTDVMYKAMEFSPYMWVFFVSFVVTATFIVINLFIAVVINNLENAKHDQAIAEQAEATPEELLLQINATRESLQQIEAQLHRRA